jgi:hypothetical protein
MKRRELLKLYFSSPRGIALSGGIVIAAVISACAGVPPVLAGLAGLILGGAGLLVSLSMGKGAAAVTGEKGRRQVLGNRARLEEAAAISRKLGNVRLADAEIKKLLVRLCYEADSYIFKAKAHPDAIYDPLTLDSLGTACSVLDTFLRSGNEAAAEKYFPAGEAESAEASGCRTMREETMLLLENSLYLFIEQNRMNRAADTDAIAAGMAAETLERKRQYTGIDGINNNIERK